MIADFNGFSGDVVRDGTGFEDQNAFVESALRARERGISFNVALRLRVYYHDETEPVLDWDALRTFINNYDLDTLPPGFTWTGTYDPLTNSAVIEGFCPYDFSSTSFGSTGFHNSTDHLGSAFAIVSRVTDFNSKKAATELVMQVGRFVFTEPTAYILRQYPARITFPHSPGAPGGGGIEGTVGVFGLSVNFLVKEGIGGWPGTSGTLLTLNKDNISPVDGWRGTHNFPDLPFPAFITGPGGVETVSVTAMGEDANDDPTWTVVRFVAGSLDMIDIPSTGTLITYNPPPFTLLGSPLGGFFVDLSTGCIAEAIIGAATSTGGETEQVLHLKVPAGGPSGAWPPLYTVGNLGIGEPDPIAEVYPSDGYALIASLT